MRALKGAKLRQGVCAGARQSRHREWRVTIRGRAFIAGAFEHPRQRISGKSTAQVHAKVAFGAPADAGLSAADVDAYLCAGDAPGLGPISMADYLGLKRLRSAGLTETGGSSCIAHVGHAAATIAVGKCRVALITSAGHVDMAARRTFRRVLRAPPHLFMADAAVLLGLSASPPPYETAMCARGETRCPRGPGPRHRPRRRNTGFHG
jgi:acetyl-CoA acetyltransferase